MSAPCHIGEFLNIFEFEFFELQKNKIVIALQGCRKSNLYGPL